MRSPVPAPVESDVGVDGWVVELDEQSAKLADTPRSLQGFVETLGNDGHLDPNAKQCGQPIIDVTERHLRVPHVRTVMYRS